MVNDSDLQDQETGRSLIPDPQEQHLAPLPQSIIGWADQTSPLLISTLYISIHAASINFLFPADTCMIPADTYCLFKYHSQGKSFSSKNFHYPKLIIQLGKEYTGNFKHSALLILIPSPLFFQIYSTRILFLICWNEKSETIFSWKPRVSRYLDWNPFVTKFVKRGPMVNA